MVKEGGLVVFVVNDQDSFLAGLKKITDLQYRSSRNDMNSLLQGLQGKKYTVRKFDTRFSGVLEKGKFNKKGKLLMEWICLKSFSEIPIEIVKKAEEFFARKTKGGHIREKEVVIMKKF